VIYPEEDIERLDEYHIDKAFQHQKFEKEELEEFEDVW